MTSHHHVATRHSKRPAKKGSLKKNFSRTSSRQSVPEESHASDIEQSQLSSLDDDSRELDDLSSSTHQDDVSLSDDETLVPSDTGSEHPPHDSPDTDSVDDWGRRPGEYYEKALEENDEESQDDENLRMHYEEAVKLQKKKWQTMPPEEYLLEDPYVTVSEKAHEPPIDPPPQEFHQEVKAILDGLGGAVTVSTCADASPQSQPDSPASSITKDHPELLALLKEIKAKASHVKQSLAPLLEKCQRDPEFATEKGLSYLEMRSQLLLSYLQYLCYYLLLKLHGISIRHHPVLDSLIEIRVLIDQLKPIETRIQAQVHSLLNENATSVLRPASEFLPADQQDDTSLDDQDLLQTMSQDDSVLIQKEARQVYNAPKVVAVHYKGEEQEKINKKKEKQDLYREKQLLQSEAAKAFQEEFADDPLEIQQATQVQLQSDSVASRLLKKEKQREMYEEETMSRLPLSKSDKKERKLLKKKRELLAAGGSHLNELTAFADEALDVPFYDPTLPSPSKPPRLTSMLNALQLDKSHKERGAAKHSLPADAYVATKKLQRPKSLDPAHEHFKRNPDTDHSLNNELSEDESLPDVIQDALKFKEQKKKARAEHRLEEGLAALPPLDPTAQGKRKLGYTILKNKGLVRRRKKTEGHARVHNREKYQKKMRSWKGIQPGGREAHSFGHYEGEATGIKTHVKKSVTFAT